MLEGKRQAVIIGINEYNDPNIPRLAGAVNDAMEMHQKLKEFGNFEVSKDHFLLDSKATFIAIRKAISDLLYKTVHYDMVLFYFSGHSFGDARKNGYLAPHDMSKDDPFVCGIKMEELRQLILDSVYTSSVLMIFDCCYSVIPTTGEKSILDAKTPFDSYFGNLNKEVKGEGKFIIATSEENPALKEINIRHKNEKEPHPHGIFTFYLLEGLDGRAADQTGIITLDGLYRYVETQLINKGKLGPKFFAMDSNQIGRIRIAVATQIHNEYIQRKIEEAEAFYSNKDLSSIILATQIISDVLKINAKNTKALELKNKISKVLTMDEDFVNQWLIMYELDVRPSVPFIFTELQKLADYLNFDKITELDKRRKQLLLLLYKVSKGEIDNNKFIAMCKIFDNPLNIQKPINPLSIQKPIIDEFKK